MMSRRTEPIWFALIVVVFVAMVGGWTGIDYTRTLIERADSTAEAHAVEAALMAEANARLAADLEAQAAEYEAASIEWERENAENRARAARARDRAERAATDLVASLDSAQREGFAEYAAERDTVEASLVAELVTERERSAALQVRVTGLMGLVAGLQGEIAAKDRQLEALDESLNAHRAALRSRNRQNTYLKLGGAAVVAFAAVNQLTGGA